MESNLVIELDILQRCIKRDRDAFRSVVEQLKRPAYYHALALSGNSQDAMDLSQEAFARAWQSISTFEPSHPFYPWYYTILKRLALNLLRAKKRHPQTSLSQSLQVSLTDTEAEQNNGIERASADGSPKHQHITAQTQQQVRLALARLSLEDSEILCLKDMHDYAYKDIALMLSIPMGTVMSRLYAARNRLRIQLQELGYEHA
ncbi:sigma-70 family RNA polymerase sigma factor [Gammaproteobacteria bacterium LSUCC0112]|nr:sigma-70 family RNA polymerase sigma factor [Gammaproteobacteria bacterium LSUCC0112]